MAAKKNTVKSSKAVVTKINAVTEQLDLIAAHIGEAIEASVSVSETLGALVREAGLILRKKPDYADQFYATCAEMCGEAGLTDASLKVYMSNIRGVCRAMIDGWEPEADATLRAMYNDAPKGKGRQAVKTGAKHATDKPTAHGTDDDADDSATPPPTKADTKRAAITALFGHCDDEMIAAVTWAASHEPRFLQFVKDQIAFDAKPSKAAALKKAA